MAYHRVLRRMACWTILGCLAVALTAAGRPGVGAEDTTPDKTTAKKKGQAKDGKKFRRLPPYYSEVIDDEQREKIYDIQEEYGPKIQALRAQLKALIEERNKKLEAVLSAEQKQQIDAARTEAKAKRKAHKQKTDEPANADE
ncbi:MAG: hypothetical protein JW959_11390 [Pirellulales bacterium]|nr:hypothetical protein [Pirellulales bacterium]